MRACLFVRMCVCGPCTCVHPTLLVPNLPPSNPTQYLHKRRIGTSLALLWCAWAFVAEKAGNFSLADKLYTKARHM